MFDIWFLNIGIITFDAIKEFINTDQGQEMSDILVRVVCVAFCCGGVSFSIKKQMSRLGMYRSEKHKRKINLWSDIFSYIFSIIISVCMFIFYDYLKPEGPEKAEIYIAAFEGVIYALGAIGLQSFLTSDSIPKAFGVFVGMVVSIFKIKGK